MNALQEARRQTGINFADILYFDGELLCRVSATVFWNAEDVVSMDRLILLPCETYCAPHAPHA